MDGRCGFLLRRLSRVGVSDLKFDGVSGVLPWSDSFYGNGLLLVSQLGDSQSRVSAMKPLRAWV